jgi:hypothetical protein
MKGQDTHLQPGTALIVFRIIFYFCAFYFLMMGAGLVLFPRLLVLGAAGTDVHPTIIGMLRGSGGAVIPYSLLYFLTARKPGFSGWGLYVIAVANILAIILDLISVFLGEYGLGYAMIDLPVELISLTGISIIWLKVKKEERQMEEGRS